MIKICILLCSIIGVDLLASEAPKKKPETQLSSQEVSRLSKLSASQLSAEIQKNPAIVQHPTIQQRMVELFGALPPESPELSQGSGSQPSQGKREAGEKKTAEEPCIAITVGPKYCPCVLCREQCE